MLPNAFVNFLRVMVLGGTVAWWALPTAMASPARFWFSYSNVDPTGIEAPQIASVENVTRYLHIWAQPATENAALPYHVTTNRFKTIQNFSLDLVTDVVDDNSDPIVDFLDGTFTVYNPLLDGKHRFQFVYDSHTTTGALISTGAALDGVVGLQGFTIVSSTASGIGHSANHPTLGCHPDDPYCAPTHDAAQSPAWLVASVGVTATSSPGDSYLHLQIGQNGMSYKNESSQIPEILFGLNSPAPGPSYDSTQLGNRQTTQSLDSPDATVNAVAAGQVQLSTWSGTTGNWADNSWTGGIPQSFSRNAKLPASLGNNVVTVTGKQLANDTAVEGGRLQIAAGASLASRVTVASGGAISGQGWVGSDLTLQTGAVLTIDALQPLLVVGSANVAGGAIQLGGNFTASGPTSVEILRTFGGIQGTLATAPGQNLGGGLFVGSINKVGDSILLQVSGVAGDFNGDNTVNAADYVVWRNSLGCSTTACMSADGNHNGVIDQPDYSVWRAHFGQTVGGSSALTSVVLPEPAVYVTTLIGFAAICFRHRVPRCGVHPKGGRAV